MSKTHSVILMRVLMVTPSYRPIKGGAEILVENLSTKLNQIGINTDIMTFNMNEKWKPYWQTNIEKIGGIKVFRIPAINWFPLKHSDRITMGINLIPGRFKNHLREYDVIHFHVGDLTFPVFLYTTRKPKVAQFHSSLAFHRRYFISRLILKNIADLYIAISQNMQRELEELGVQPNKIRYVPNAVDTSVFQAPRNKERNLILFVGRITFGKGLHILLNSLHKLEIRTHLVIIGPPDWDVEYFEEIRRQIDHENRRGIHKITYLGAQEQGCIAEWCQKASIFVLPSFREASPVTILEAMSCETPVVATDVGGISEVVVNGKNGILIPTNNPEELASSIQYLLDNEPARANLGREGRKTVVEHFSYDVVIKTLCQIYRELL